jgi:hypothetical protein
MSGAVLAMNQCRDAPVSGKDDEEDERTMNRSPALVFALFMTMAFSLSGCASSSQVVNQWVSPEYDAPRFRHILVLGVSKQPSIRRAFEDRFVARLKAEGVNAVQSYLYIPEDGEAAEALLQTAVRQAKADAALIARLVRVEKKTEYSPGFYQPSPAFGYGFYPGYRAAWVGYYEPPRIYQYDVYISETSLYDLEKNQLVWSGTVRTSDPGDIGKEIQSYVEIVVQALKSKNLLPAGSS